MQSTRPFSRSPHPYTRTRTRTSKPPSKTPSDSGTEADDESTGLLKGLPAPPARPRKGLDDGTTKRAGSDGLERKKAGERRAEVLRRVCEVGLVLGVGVVVLRPAEVRDLAWVWRGEILVHILLVATLYALYPLSVSRFTIPASFDPAPLLYPIAVPVFVALSLTQRRPTLVLPNIVLGLSSLPTPVVPLQSWRQGYSILHWTVTLVPIVVAEYYVGKPLALLYGLDAEALTLVFPLHQALIPVLDFLLATSLLPAELQLLATGLINLLLFASSPQAQILKALLWLGALCVFILCRHVLRWEVALARIPSWRFRRYPTSSQSRRTLLNDMDHAFCEQLSRGEVPGSDSEVERVPSRRTMHDMSQQQEPEKEKPARRHTIAGVEEPRPTTHETAKGRRKKRVTAPELASLLSLTVSQAQVRKWLYAAYVYLAIAAIIMLPVRKYVADDALAGDEPFGWALGYLFGNLPMFRFWVVMMNREYWIRLPVRRDFSSSSSSSWCAHGFIEHLRYETFGEANTRLLLCAYCSVVMLTGLAVVFQLSSLAAVDTRRKVFHGMMVLMFLPTIYIDPTFCALALATVLAIFLLLDLFRASQVPPISRPLTYFLAPYVDGRDHRGPVIVSHIFLLVGCSIPLWLSLADLPRAGPASASASTATADAHADPWSGWDVLSRDTSMVSGVVCVGMGDAAASLIGRRFGRVKWFWGGGKSLEGSVAFTLAVCIGLVIGRVWLLVGGWPLSSASSGLSSGLDHGWWSGSGSTLLPWTGFMLRALLAAAGTSLTEAILTGCNDNVAVPVILWLLVRGMRV